MSSFANQLLSVQRQAAKILTQHLSDLDPVAIEQSFLLRGGKFAGVRWQAGEWSAEWLLATSELVLRQGRAEAARFELELVPAETAESEPLEHTDSGLRRAA